MFRLILTLSFLPAFGALGADGSPPEGANPAGWRLVAARDEIAPRAWTVRGQAGEASDGLALAGNGGRSVDGRWVRRTPVKGGTHVAFRARYSAKDVETPTRSVVASVLWFDDRGEQVERAEFPAAAERAEADGPVSAEYLVRLNRAIS